MEGVVGVLMLFIFACVGFPRMVKHRTQFYAAVMLVAGIIALNVVAWVFGSPWGSGGEDHSPSGFFKLMYVFIGILEVAAFVMLILATGGLSLHELTGELATTIEVIRRGEDKPVIIPLTGEKPKPRRETSDEPPPRIDIDAELGLDSAPPVPPVPPAPKPVIRAPRDEGSIPLD